MLECERNLRVALSSFDRVTAYYADNGAADTEPDRVFQDTLYRHYKRDDYKVPRTPDDWELYHGTRHVDQAARALTDCLLNCISKINDCSTAMVPVLPLIEDHLWRINR